jgi:hypothetical protein
VVVGSLRPTIKVCLKVCLHGTAGVVHSNKI